MKSPWLVPSVLVVLLALRAHAFQERSKTPPGDWHLDIGQRSTLLRLGVDHFTPGTPEAKTAASELTEVLRNDLEFASVFEIVSDEEKAEVLIGGEVTLEGNSLLVEVRFHDLVARKVAFRSEYRAPDGETRRLAHRIADDVLARAGIQGVAQTQIAFSSRPGAPSRTIARMDYDGARQRPIGGGFLEIGPRWSPDGRSILFVTFPHRYAFPRLALATGDPTPQVLFESEKMVFPGSWSPDGLAIAFASSKDGNPEIYVMDKTGGRIRRLTDHPGIDVSPTWSPTGREVAFTSNRGGSPQIYVMDTEGLNLRRISLEGSYNAEPAWSPSTDSNEIAYASRVAGNLFDLAIHDLLTGQTRFVTSGSGINESPSWAPNGRHLAFASTRTGVSQIFTMNRDGSNVRQLTFEGSNATPSWSPAVR